jgi:hypothetical protein
MRGKDQEVRFRLLKTVVSRLAPEIDFGLEK